VTVGSGTLTVPGRDGRPDLRVHVAAPAGAGPEARLTIVLHGTERNAAEYLAAWEPWAARQRRIVLAPEFDRLGWPGSRGYALGGVLTAKGRARPRSSWAFAALTELHRYARARFGLADDRFDLWGHSAGAQFVHRYLLFAPTAPVRLGVAANAGWYSLPDLDRAFPYGLRHRALSFRPAHVAAWARRPLVLMRGTADVVRDEHLRTTPQAQAQGPHRYARAATMLRAGHAVSAECRWLLLDVPGAGHDFTAMAPAAQALLAGEPVSAGAAAGAGAAVVRVPAATPGSPPAAVLGGG
jgi:poly(3-hydroxybutyrate) depolymerase